MPFNATISNQAARRASGYQARQFIVANPGTVVFRCQPSIAPTSPTYAEFTYGSVSIGSFGAVKEGQTVIISSDTAMTNILFRGRVRKVPTSSVFYINQTSFALQTSHYVSVIDQYDLVERLERITGATTILKDFDLTYQNLPPVITNLQSSYVLPTTAPTATLALAPTAQAMASGATISSWLWDVADGTITVGSPTTQNITVSFPAGYRWVILRVTDSNGVTTRYCCEVWVGNPDAATDGQLLRATEGASITGSWENGWNASIEWFDGLAGLLPGTRITIWSEHRYGDGTTSTTVDFVGYLQNDDATLTGDETNGQVKATTVNAYGFASLLGRLKAPSARLVRKATPSAWGDIKSPTPARVLTYALAWHSTAFNLCSFQWAADDSNYESDDLDLEQFYMLELMTYLLARYNAQATFAPSGEIRAARNACYLSSSARNALATITTLTTDDYLSVTLETRYTPLVGSIIVPAVAYQTTKDITTAYMAKAPAVTALYSGEERTLDSQILVADAGDTAWRAELAARAGDELAYLNRSTIMTLDLIDSYSDLVPTNNQWFVLQLSADDNPAGRAYTSERWQLTEISINAVSPDGVRTVSATFQLETIGEGAQVLVTRLASNADLINPNIPAVGPFDNLDQPWNSPTNQALDLNYSPLSQDLGRGNPPGGRYPQGAGCETINVPMWTNTTISTIFTPIPFKTYTAEIIGAFVNTIGPPTNTSWLYTNLSSPYIPPANFGFTSSLGLQNIAIGGYGIYVGGPSFQTASIEQTMTLPSKFVVSATWYVAINGTPTISSPLRIRAYDGAIVIAELDTSIPNVGGPVAFTINPNAVVTSIEIEASVNQTFCLLVVTQFTVTFGDATYCDAFYSVPLDGSSSPTIISAPDGLFFNSVSVPAPSAFNPSSLYTIDITPATPFISFRYEQITNITTVPRAYLIIRICPREVT